MNRPVNNGAENLTFTLFQRLCLQTYFRVSIGDLVCDNKNNLRGFHFVLLHGIFKIWSPAFAKAN